MIGNIFSVNIMTVPALLH